jgi:hypothetical protein
MAPICLAQNKQGCFHTKKSVHKQVFKPFCKFLIGVSFNKVNMKISLFKLLKFCIAHTLLLANTVQAHDSTPPPHKEKKD